MPPTKPDKIFDKIMLKNLRLKFSSVLEKIDDNVYHHYLANCFRISGIKENILEKNHNLIRKLLRSIMAEVEEEEYPNKDPILFER